MKAALVLLSDRLYLDKTKAMIQMCRSVGKWPYDFVLFAHNCLPADVAWFENNNIKVFHVDHIYNDEQISSHYNDKSHKSHFTLLKLHLFHSRMKEWDQIVFYDIDVLIKNSIEPLAHVKGIHAVRGSGNDVLNNRWKRHYRKLFEELIKFENLPAPNGGLYAFSTDIIDENTFDDLCKMAYKYREVIQFEEGVIGTYFADKMQWLNQTWNCPYGVVQIDTKHKRPLPNVIHFVGNEHGPWVNPKKMREEWEQHYYAVNEKYVLPNLIICGFQKCATTSMALALARNPDVGLGLNPLIQDGQNCGEIHYFNQFFHLGETWYRTCFRGLENKTVIVDKTPNYINDPIIMKRMSYIMPNVKLLVMIRNPIDRLLSQYQHMLRYPYQRPDMLVTKNLIEHVSNDGLMIEYGRYYKYLKAALLYFDKSQIRVVISERLHDKNYVEDIRQWLGVRHLVLQEENVGNYKDQLTAIEREIINTVYHQDNQELFDFLKDEIPEWK